MLERFFGDIKTSLFAYLVTFTKLLESLSSGITFAVPLALLALGITIQYWQSDMNDPLSCLMMNSPSNFMSKDLIKVMSMGSNCYHLNKSFKMPSSHGQWMDLGKGLNGSYKVHIKLYVYIQILLWTLPLLVTFSRSFSFSPYYNKLRCLLDLQNLRNSSPEVIGEAAGFVQKDLHFEKTYRRCGDIYQIFLYVGRVVVSRFAILMVSLICLVITYTMLDLPFAANLSRFTAGPTLLLRLVDDLFKGVRIEETLRINGAQLFPSKVFCVMKEHFNYGSRNVFVSECVLGFNQIYRFMLPVLHSWFVLQSLYSLLRLALVLVTTVVGLISPDCVVKALLYRAHKQFTSVVVGRKLLNMLLLDHKMYSERIGQMLVEVSRQQNES